MARTIEEETALIEELENNYPDAEYKSTAWWQHVTKIQDAYWRRRNLRCAEEQNISLLDAARKLNGL